MSELGSFLIIFLFLFAIITQLCGNTFIFDEKKWAIVCLFRKNRLPL